MIFNLIGYHLSRNRRIFKYLANTYGTSRYRVYALARGKRARTQKDYCIAGELAKRRLRF